MSHAVRQLTRPVALVAIAGLAAASVGTVVAAAPSPSPTPDSPRVVFRVDWEGGFVMPGTELGRLPVVVVYEDGRVVVQGPQVEIWPAPMLPNLQVRTLTPQGLARLEALAKARGLLKDAHYDYPLIADATTTVLTIQLDGATYRVSAYALGEAGTDDVTVDGGVLDEAARLGRADLRAFIDALTGIPDGDFADEWATLEPEALKIIATQVNELPDEAGNPVAWPIGVIDDAGVVVGDASLGMRCIEVSGDDLDALLPVLHEANALTPFTSGGATFSLIVRPLLPGEAGC